MSRSGISKPSSLPLVSLRICIFKRTISAGAADTALFSECFFRVSLLFLFEPGHCLTDVIKKKKDLPIPLMPRKLLRNSTALTLLGVRSELGLAAISLPRRAPPTFCEDLTYKVACPFKAPPFPAPVAEDRQRQRLIEQASHVTPKSLEVPALLMTLTWPASTSTATAAMR